MPQKALLTTVLIINILLSRIKWIKRFWDNFGFTGMSRDINPRSTGRSEGHFYGQGIDFHYIDAVAGDVKLRSAGR